METSPQHRRTRSRSTVTLRLLGFRDSFFSRHSSSSRNHSAAVSWSCSWARIPPAARASPARIGDAVRCHNRVLRVAESHKGNVESSAAEVIYEQSTFSAIPPISAVAVGKLYGGGRRLVRQPKYFETGSPRCLFGEESLVAVGVRWHSEHHLQPVRFVSPQRGALHQFVTQCRHHLCRCKAQIDPLTGNFDLAAGPRVLEPALERTHDGPTWFAV